MGILAQLIILVYAFYLALTVNAAEDGDWKAAQGEGHARSMGLGAIWRRV